MRLIDIELETAEPAACQAFYRQTLGLPAAPWEGPGFAVQAGRTRLGFRPGRPGCYHLAFNIPENQHLPARDWLRERVPLLSHAGSDSIAFQDWNAHSLYCLDPAGNVIELIARHNLANAADAPFDAGGFLSVSELGVPVAAIGGLVDELASRWGAPLWSGNRDRFAAVGDEEGLLIVVAPGRPWFPTALPAVTPSLGLTVRAAGNGTLAAVPANYRLTAGG